MTPKEKAIELVEKFMNIDSDSEMFDGFKMTLFYSQRCALIAVDEILEFAYNYTDYNEKSTKEYLEKVKHEINKL
jgi:hypothetical protein